MFYNALWSGDIFYPSIDFYLFDNNCEEYVYSEIAIANIMRESIVKTFINIIMSIKND